MSYYILTVKSQTFRSFNDMSAYLHAVLFLGQAYYLNVYTKESQWDRPTKPAEPGPSCGGGGGSVDQVRCSHLLVKHRESRRPSSWREDNITRTKEEALKIIDGMISLYLTKYI